MQRRTSLSNSDDRIDRVFKHNQKDGKIRKRTQVACERCRKRKIKCSGDSGDGHGCDTCRAAGAGGCRYARMQTYPIHIEEAPSVTHPPQDLSLISSAHQQNSQLAEANPNARYQVVHQDHHYNPGHPQAHGYLSVPQTDRYGAGTAQVSSSRYVGHGTPSMSNSDQLSSYTNRPAIPATESLTTYSHSGHRAMMVANMFADESDHSQPSSSSPENTNNQARLPAYEPSTIHDSNTSPTNMLLQRTNRFRVGHLLFPSDPAALAPTSHANIHQSGPTTDANLIDHMDGASSAPTSIPMGEPTVRETAEIANLPRFRRPIYGSQYYHADDIASSAYTSIASSSSLPMPTEPRVISYPQKISQRGDNLELPNVPSSSGNNGYSESGVYSNPPPHSYGLNYNPPWTHDYAVPHVPHPHFYNNCTNSYFPGYGPIYNTLQFANRAITSDTHRPYDLQRSGSLSSAFSGAGGTSARSSFSASAYSGASGRSTPGYFGVKGPHQPCIHLPVATLRSELAKDREEELGMERRDPKEPGTYDGQGLEETAQ